ncbi:MAG TPA: outer membrane protein assembly factor BamD [Candidatus Binataceae bacterium]|nr:outer membrane protein assembly factor BamD [Candidatus Binataceae bacterium]
MKKRVATVTVACALLATAGCSARKPPNGENYYVQATNEYSQHYYDPAIADYQKLIDEYPFSPYAEEAELNIGLAYYKSHNYAEAIGSFNDFLRMHPTSKQLDIASYYLARSHFDQMGRPDQDQTHTQLALEQFESIERRFPESDFAALAREQVDICRDVLARHEFLIGEFYVKRANFTAAESRMAELLAIYPDTPIAPEGLYELGVTLAKQGKKYSAAQAFTALKQHFPNTPYAVDANNQLKRLKQPIDTEEDPLKLVLAEIGYSSDQADQQVAVHESVDSLSSGGSGGAYGADGLPTLTTAAAATAAPSSGANSTIGAQPRQQNPGPATLKTVRLSSSDPPLSVIFDLSGPVAYDQHLDNGDGSASFTLYLKQVTPGANVPNHVSFERSIFHDCDIATDAGGTRITLNLTPVSRYAVVPLLAPPRLLVTFTPAAANTTASSESGLAPN